MEIFFAIHDFHICLHPYLSNINDDIFSARYLNDKIRETGKGSCTEPAPVRGQAFSQDLAKKSQKNPQKNCLKAFSQDVPKAATTSVKLRPQAWEEISVLWGDLLDILWEDIFSMLWGVRQEDVTFGEI